MDLTELSHIRGLRDAKAVRLKAALELGRRLAERSPAVILASAMAG